MTETPSEYVLDFGGLLKARAGWQKKLDEAIQVLQNAIAIESRNAQLHARLGRAYLEKKELAAARRELRLALEIDAKWTDALRDLVAVSFLAEQ